MTKQVNTRYFVQAERFCLAFLLFLSVSIVNVKASSIIEIHTIDDLYEIEQCYTCNYVLMSDLDFNDPIAQENSSNYSKETGWRAIGKATKSYFTGSLDGNGFVFKNLVMKSTTNYLGLIYQSNSAVFKNIVFENVNIQGNNYVGALIAKNAFDTSILNVSVSGTIQGKTYVGSVLGLGAQTTLDQIYSNATVIGERSVGGIVGALTEKGTLSNAHSQANVNGLMCGDNNSSSTCSVGGVVGSVTSGAGNVNQVFFNGELIHGKNESFNNVYTKYIHPLIGSDQKGLENVGVYYYKDNPYLIEDSLTNEQLPLEVSYESFDFETIWSIENHAYLRNNTYFDEVIEEVGIKIEVYPHKLEYEYDQEIDLEGLVVHVEYSDGSSSKLSSSQYSITVDKESQVVTIRYLEFETSFEVIILPREKYTIEIIETGVGGRLKLTTNNDIIENNQLLDKGSIIDVEVLTQPLARIKSLTINEAPLDERSFVLNQDTIIEVEYVLLGDLDNDRDLTKKDLKYYLPLLEAFQHNLVSNTNEDDKTTIADYVYLNNYLNGTTEHSSMDYMGDSVIEIDLYEVMQREKEVDVILNINFNNVDAIYLNTFVDKHEISDIKVENQNAHLQVNERLNALVISNLSYENESQSLRLVITMVCNESCEEETTLSLDSIQYSELLGIDTYTCKDTEFVINQQHDLNDEDEITEEEGGENQNSQDEADNEPIEESVTDKDDDKTDNDLNTDNSFDDVVINEEEQETEISSDLPNMSHGSMYVVWLLVIGVIALVLSNDKDVKKSTRP